MSSIPNGVPIPDGPGSVSGAPNLPAGFAALANDLYFGNAHCADPKEFCIDESLNQTQAVYAVAQGFYGNDWTDTQDVIDTAISGNLFFNPQYGALAAFSSIGNSSYNAGNVSNKTLG